MKIRKFRAGDMVESASDSEEDKAKAAGQAASNAEKKSSGFLGLGRLFEGNIDEKGSKAYNKYGAGYGREVEAENTRLKEKTGTETKAAPLTAASNAAAANNAAAAAPLTAASTAAASAARAKAAAESASAAADKNDTADMKRNAAGPSTTSSTTPDARDEGVRAAKRGQGSAAAKVKAAGPSTTPDARDEGVRAAKRGQGSAAAAKAPAAAKASAANTRTGATYKDMENANARPAANPMSKDPSQQAPAPAGARAGQEREDSYADDTSLSFAERRKRAEMRAKRGSTTDTRSVNERFKDLFKAKGGAIRGYASGGSVSASSRGDGIAQRGKTRGKMC